MASSPLIRAPSKTPRASEPQDVPQDVREKWQDGTVASLSLLPVAAVSPDSPVRTALAASRAHRGQCVLVVENEQLQGYVDMVDLVAQETQGSLDDAVRDIQRRFVPDATFRIIHSHTPLGDVAAFLQTRDVALVTDDEGQYITNVIVPGDLMRYADHQPAARAAIGSRSEEETRRDHAMVEILRQLHGYTPLIPDEVTDYYLERAGFQCEDVRLKRLLALATEKFVSDIASDAFQYARIRTNAGPSRSHRPGASARDRTRTVLTMDDLSAALGEYGIDARRAETFR